MKPISLVLAAALLGSLPVYSQKKSPSAKKTSASAKAIAEARVNPDFVAARKAFDAGKMDECASKINVAADKMLRLVEGSDLPAANGVTSSAKNLGALAKATTEGKVKEAAKLNQAFAAAHQHMAQYQHARAEAFVAEKKNLQAGRAMDRTADHVELAAEWSGTKLDSSENAVVKGLRGVAGGLIGGAGTVVEGTGSVLKKGLGLITGLGGKIQGEAKPDSGNLGKEAVEGTRKVTGGAVKGAGQVGETGAGAVEKTGTGIKKLGDKVSGKKE